MDETFVKNLSITNQLLVAEAERRGYELRAYAASTARSNVIVEGQKNNRKIVFHNSLTLSATRLGSMIANNKYLNYSVLTGNDVRMPETIVIADNDQELLAPQDFLRNHGKVVVKPIDNNHGNGITTDVADAAGLMKAVRKARDYCKNISNVLVQQQVAGKEYRFLVIGDEVVAVAHRQPPFVVGDGVSTIAELVEKKNTGRDSGHRGAMTTIKIDEVADYIGAETLSTVPRENEVVKLLSTSNLSRGGEAVNVTEIASPALKALAVRAAQLCHLHIAGVDIMTTDISGDKLDNSYIIEINTMPGLRMHQFPAVGEPINVVGLVFDEIERLSFWIDKNSPR
jgi:cyanophycin synthetase